MNLLPLALLALAQAGGDMGTAKPGALEGRPPAAETSAVQAWIDAAPPGGEVIVPPGQYEGDVILDKPLRLLGRGRPLLLGSGGGSVIRVRADGVTVEGFDIDGRGGGDLGRDTSGIHVSGTGAVLRDCRISGSIFGIYLRGADDATVEGCRIRGIPGKDPGEKGSGVHVWSTERFHVSGCTIEDVRDGFYIQSSGHGMVRENTARDLRYGIHYMFSDENAFEDNRFENGAAGAALMYSRGITFRRNEFLRNRGFASVGLLFKECDDVLAESNLVADNARGIFMDGSRRNVFRGNVIASSDAAIVLYDSCAGNRFEGNSFVGNLSPLNLVGRRTDTVFEGNYWSENRELDLDGDGRTDRPYRLSNVFDHFRGNLLAADLLAQGFAGATLGLAEEAFPVLDPVPVLDRSPLARPPALPEVPRPTAPVRQAGLAGLLGSLALLALGAIVLLRGRR